MKLCILGCGIYELELEQVLAQIKQEKLFDCELEVTHLPLNLHINLDALKAGVIKALDAVAADRIILLYGSKCHPDFNEFLSGYHNLVRFEQSNCIELMIGERMKETDQESKTFYLTSGWLEKWRELFDSGFGIDEVELRQSFGFYDRTLLVDTGVSEITDEKILDFFEYTQVPIEMEQGGIAVFKSYIITAIQQAIHDQNANE
ncbi:DUF1638 domain-containing protein [Dehalobacter sp.]|uniref:DUF1638 domain-containing protein n=1 Tax=Dehalobacter sp. TaxID=1962289 RepID=UPI002589204C|nr:DUF1638 domain-containing protein [Dehalobacter sp.]MDJ0306644.1 DUF1638 domain-containing protein [Dehalobacter sp.]